MSGLASSEVGLKGMPCLCRLELSRGPGIDARTRIGKGCPATLNLTPSNKVEAILYL
jgi:hypothetical protein